MKKQVIFIYGASGSGTTNLGEYICKELGFHHKFSCKILELTDIGTIEEEFEAVKAQLCKQ